MGRATLIDHDTDSDGRCVLYIEVESCDSNPPLQPGESSPALGLEVALIDLRWPSDSLIPYRITIARARFVAFFKSSAAPVVVSLKMISSAVRPPSAAARSSMSLERRCR